MIRFGDGRDHEIYRRSTACTHGLYDSGFGRNNINKSNNLAAFNNNISILFNKNEAAWRLTQAQECRFEANLPIIKPINDDDHQVLNSSLRSNTITTTTTTTCSLSSGWTKSVNALKRKAINFENYYSDSNTDHLDLNLSLKVTPKDNYDDEILLKGQEDINDDNHEDNQVVDDSSTLSLTLSSSCSKLSTKLKKINGSVQEIRNSGRTKTKMASTLDLTL